MRILELLFLSVYMIVVIVLGIIYRRSGSDEDFVMGSRTIERFGSTMTIFATLVTESLIFFAVTLTALYGPIGALAGVAGPSLGLLTLSFVAPKVHDEASDKRYICVTEYCKQKWGPVTGRIAQVVLLMLMGWVIVLQINLNEKIMSGITGWKPVTSTVITVVVVLFYLSVGGYRAEISTDIFQGFIVGIMLLLPLFISPQPDLAAVLDVRFVSVNVLFIFITSFALTITRPEMWQRIYSASSGQKAAQSMRIVSVLFFVFGCFVVYYALAILQAVPGVPPDQAFAVGYRSVLPPILTALFPVLLLAAMMSSLDSAAFLLSADLASLHERMKLRRKYWARVFMMIVLIGSGILSLTVFNSLTFAYKLNGIVALFAVPLLMSLRLTVPGMLVGISILVGFVTYGILLVTGRIDRNPVEAILAAIVTAGILLLGYVVMRYLAPHHPTFSHEPASQSDES